MRHVGMVILFLCIALTGCKPQPAPPYGYVPEVPAPGTPDSISVSIFSNNPSCSGPNCGNLLTAVNQTPPPLTKAVVAQINPSAPNILLTVVATATDKVAGVSEIEIDEVMATCDKDGNYTGGAITPVGSGPVAQYSSLPYVKSSTLVMLPISTAVLATIPVSQDLGTSYQVNYQFIGRAANALNASVTTAQIWFWATADNQKPNAGCAAGPFGST